MKVETPFSRKYEKQCRKQKELEFKGKKQSDSLPITKSGETPSQEKHEKRNTDNRENFEGKVKKWQLT